MTSDPAGRAVRARPALLLLGAVLAAAWTLGPPAPSWPQVPDNRGVRLDPEDPISPAYRDSLDARDSLRLEHARESGESFLPTFHGRGQAPTEPPGDAAADEEDDAGTYHARPTPRAEPARPEPVYEAVGGLQPQGGSPAGLSGMIGVLLETWSRAPEVVRLRYANDGDAAPDAARQPAPTRRDTPAPGDPLPPIEPGAGFYARTVYAVNSDYPGPVVLELLQPPLAGAIATGGFELVRDRMVLRLTALTRRGETLPVDALAVGLDCACYGIPGEVDRHFFTRVLLPAAVRFAEGFLTAAGMPERTLTLHGGDTVHETRKRTARRDLYAGLGAAARAMGEVLLQDAPGRPTVRIPPDTELIVTFMAPPGRGGENADARQ